MRTEKPLTVKLVGGIGNQLFGYFAGLAVSRNLGVGLNLDLTDLRMGRSTHTSSIEALDLPGVFSWRVDDQSNLKQVTSRICSRLKRAYPSLNRFSGSYTSVDVGFDPAILKTTFSKKYITGYFQSYRYHDLCSHAIPEPKLKNPSRWFINSQKKIQDHDVIAIHIRRGDYRKLSESFGMLNSSYYKGALEVALSLVPNAKCWVFSDDISEARKLLSNLTHDFTFVEPPKATEPAESLLLMSSAKANVIANSTFSWWSAKLNSKTQIVLAPDKWFKALDDPLDLYPSNWILEKSSWTSN